MSERFTASNGVEVFRDSAGDLNMLKGGEGDWIFSHHETALREFFLQEEGLWFDRTTGKWVFEFENTSEKLGRSVAVLGEGIIYWENIINSGTELTEVNSEGAVRRYFDFISPRKPWHYAEQGEIWEVKLEGYKLEPRAVMRRDDGTGSFVDPQARRPSIPLNDTHIESARRIWPADSED